MSYHTLCCIDKRRLHAEICWSFITVSSSRHVSSRVMDVLQSSLAAKFTHERIYVIRMLQRPPSCDCGYTCTTKRNTIGMSALCWRRSGGVLDALVSSWDLKRRVSLFSQRSMVFLEICSKYPYMLTTLTII